MDRKMDRRTFVRAAAISGAALGLGVALAGCSDVGTSSKTDDGATDAASSDAASSSASKEVAPGTSAASVVYITHEISSDSLIAIYEALGTPMTGNVAVKVSTGEPGGHNFLSPELIKGLVQSVDGTIVECNTAYGDKRSSTESHLQAAADHGFADIADVVIMDANGDVALPVENGRHLASDYVGKALLDYDSVIDLAHFKGHGMAGFGGVIKNASIGIASSRGKCLIHSGGASETSISGPQDDFLESMGEAAKAVADHFGERIVYIDVMNNLSVDCDCASSPAEPDMEDIGILASLDPVALDQACVDLVYSAPDGSSLVERIESRNGLHTLDYAESIGLGSKAYELVSI